MERGMSESTSGQIVSIGIPEPLSWVLAFGENDWMLWAHPDDFEARVRVDPTGPGITVTGLALLADEGEEVSARQLRHLPLGRLKGVLNHPVIAREIRAPNNSSAEGRAEFDYSPAKREIDWAVFGHGPLTIERDYRIEGVDETSRPDAFYETVAEKWATAALYNEKRPADTIASANGVAVSAVNRWVWEARRRGVMAPTGRRSS